MKNKIDKRITLNEFTKIIFVNLSWLLKVQIKDQLKNFEEIDKELLNNCIEDL